MQPAQSLLPCLLEVGIGLVSRYFVRYKIRKVLRLLYANEMGDGVTWI